MIFIINIASQIIKKIITMKRKCYNLILMSALFFVASTVTLTAQTTVTPCGSDEHLMEMFKKYPDLQRQYDEYNKQMDLDIINNRGVKAQNSPVLYIPVVFHIIHINGTENIADANIYNAIDYINDDWSKNNPYRTGGVGYGTANNPFDTLQGDLRIQFRLAKLDPDGNCTNGIERIYSHLTNNADDQSKLHPWPNDKYLNIWVIRSFKTATQGVQPAAYSTVPASGSWSPLTDGVICLYDYVGTLSPSFGPFPGGLHGHGSTLSHEIGHFFNLQHPWGSGDITQPVASRLCGDDGVDDTPVTKGHTNFSIADKIPNCVKQHNSSWLYNFSAVTPVSGTIDPAVIPADDTLYRTTFSAHGVSTNSADSSRFAFTNWGIGAVDGDDTLTNFTGAIDTNKYYEVRLAPGFGYSTVFKTLSFNVKRNSTGVRTFAVRSSANNYQSNLPASISPANAQLGAGAMLGGTNVFYIKSDTNTNVQNGCKITLPANTAEYTNVIDTTTFRFYGWNAEDSTGTFSIDNVTFVDTTGLIENYENIMDYTYEDRMFTKGQEARVRAAANSGTAYRNHLWITSNLQATGTDLGTYPVCVPKPDFVANRENICVGSSVTFTSSISNISQGGTATRLWDFGQTGVSMTSSTVANPTVTYTAAGDYAVTLNATSPSGTGTETKTAFIHVSPGWPQYNGNATENFEGSNYWGWDFNNYDSNAHTWSIVNSTGYSGNHSIAMGGYNNYHDDLDDFITPGFNLFGMSGNTFTFRCAAASTALTAADCNDQLKVYSTQDCGLNWTVRKTLVGSALCNNGFKATGYAPSTQSEWALITFTIPSSLATGNVRFKFEYKTGLASNNIFIDDININGAVGIVENSIDDANVSVFPNPTNETATIAYHLNTKGNVKIEVFDVVGKKITEINNKTQSEGDYTTTISKQDNGLTNGIYFIKFSIDGKAITRKIVFTN